MTRILILDGETNAARSVLQSLGRRGYECWLAAASNGAPAFSSRYLRQKALYPDPLSDKAAFQDWILSFQQEHRFQLIIPTGEASIVPLHDIREKRALDGRLALPPAAAMEVAFDKEKVRQLAETLEISSPANLLVTTPPDLHDPRIDDWLADAVVVKSLRSKVWEGGTGHHQRVELITDRRRLEELVDERLRYTPVQVQQWVPGRGIGIELLTRDGEPVLAFAHERLHELPLYGGGSCYRRSIEPPPALLEDATRLLRSLRWHGVAMVEFRAHEPTGRYWLMEINGRFWGSLPLAVYAGADFPAALVDLLLHDRVPERFSPARINVYARQLSRDVQWFKAVLKHDAHDKHLLTRPVPASLLECSRLLTSRETLDGAALGDPGPILHELSQTVREELVDPLWRRLARKAQLTRARLRARQQAQRLARARRILLLCYGNICRSAYAEKWLLPRTSHPGVTIRSGGFHEREGRPSTDLMQLLAAERGVDLSLHRSRRLTAEDLQWSDAIVIMDEKNYRALAQLDRASLSKVVWLGMLVPDGPPEIADPYAQPPPVAAEILGQMERALEALLALLPRS